MTLVLLAALSAPALAGDPPAAPAAEQAQAVALVDAYEAARDALAADRYADVPAAARTLATAGAAHADLAAAAGALAAASDPEAMRRAFAETTRQLVRALGPSAPPKIHVFRCPMWKGGYAYWIQTKAALGNPYMGTAMPTCGERASWKEAFDAAAR